MPDTNHRADEGNRHEAPRPLWMRISKYTCAYHHQKNETDAESDRETNRRIAYWTKWTAFGTWAAAVIGSVAAIVFASQLYVTLSDDAPFVSLKGVAFLPSGDANTSLLSVDWQNTGRTPTIEMHTQVNFLSMAGGAWRDSLANCNYKTSHPRIALGAQSTETLAIQAIPKSVVNGLIGGTRIDTHIWGVAIYKDGLWRNHETRFCWKLESESEDNGVALVAHTLCGFGNCTDDECKPDDSRYPPLGTCQIEVTGGNIVLREPKTKK